MLNIPSVTVPVRAALLASGASAQKIDRQGICGALPSAPPAQGIGLA
jgi:hypothetical protein